MQVTVLKFWNYSKSSTITTQTSYVQWIHSPFLLLCSSELLDWLLIMEKGDCLPSSQHLLRSIGFLASHLLSKLLRDLTNALRVVCMPLVLGSIHWLRVYIEIHWFDRFWPSQSNCTWCIILFTLTASLYALWSTEPSLHCLAHVQLPRGSYKFILFADLPLFGSHTLASLSSPF